MTSFFTTSLSLLRSTGIGTNSSISNLSTLFFKLFHSLSWSFNLSIFNLSASDFKLVKLVFLANFDVSTPVAFFKSAFAA